MADHLDEAIGRRVNRRRRIMGMTQQQLGEAVGVRFQQIQKYECGSNRVSAARLWMLAQALAVPVDYFFDAPELASSSTSGKKADIETTETYTLVRAFSNMSTQPRRRLLRLALSLSDMG